MPIKYIKKRDGQIVPFDLVRIQSAIKKAIVSSRAQVAEDFVMKLSELVIETTNQKFNLPDTIPGVEDIQDIIEMKLAESGNFSIAKAYILYREEHKKQRVAESLTNLEKFEKNLLTVTKHNGTREAFSRIKLENFWNIIAREYIQICPFNEIFEKFKTTLVNEVSTVQLLKNLRKSALDLVTVKNINWQLMAGRLYSVELYKAAMRTRGLKQNEIYTPLAWKNHFDNYIAKKLYSTKMRETYTDAEIIEAGSWINTDRDFEYGYSTLLAFYKRYLLNPNKIIHELPQEMYLAVSLFLAMPELPNDRLRVARAIYEATSTQKLSLATPTLLNARTNFHQLSSCFKMNVEDDLRSIFHSVENMAQISKFGGGVGVYLGHIRSKGGSIRGVKNTSGGIVPWARVINDTACAVNQLGSRMGAISITLDIWHKDIHDFLDLQTETGDMRSKAFDIFPAISVPDIFMERAEAGLDWTLFDPQEVEKLFGKRLEDHFCDEFKKFYLQCENDPRLELKKTVNARDVLKKVLKTTVETGMPYFFFRDTVNKTNPNKHAGNIYTTQLCTEI
ncbi:MAG: ATP cone domain-containing protein, partial [Candidatus Falkowbacteria bacterium]|nr:ATP cone domain-containing protein [Candidatus Falkowbacteria bacterium]